MAPRTQRAVVLDALAIGAATGAYGISFGALAVAGGFDAAQAQVLSLGMFTGASQFATVAIMGAGGSAVAAVATALLLGLRNGLYALSLARDLAPRGLARLGIAQLTIDESTAMAVAASEDGDARRIRFAFLVTGISVFVLWNLGTLVGALAAGAIGDPRAYGLDAAAAAAFLALLWPRLAHPEARVTAIAAAALTVALIPLVSPGIPVLASAAVAVAAGVVGRGR